MPEIAILGGGLTGLSTAYFLKSRDWALYEKEDRVGGLCRTVNHGGFLFDHTGHWLHLARPETRRLVTRLLRGNLESHARNTWIYSKGVYTRYPFQENTYGLPPDTVKDCLLGYIEAWFAKTRGRPGNFEEWILRSLGSGVAGHFMIPYNEKLWTMHPRDLSCDWLGKYVPRPELAAVVAGALSDQASSIGYNASFLYPKHGGIQSLVDAFHDRLPRGRVFTGHEIERIDLGRRVLTTANGRRESFRRLVSTLPLPALLQRLHPAPRSLAAAGEGLVHNRVVNLNFGTSRPVGEGRHWVYFPEPGFVFYRVGFPGNVSPSTVPPGRGSIYTEVSYRDVPPGKNLRHRIVRDLVRAGILGGEHEIVEEVPLHIPCAYVIYDHRRAQAVRRIQRFLSGQGVFLAGRYGAWEYSAMEDAILWGMKAAEWATARPGRSPGPETA